MSYSSYTKIFKQLRGKPAKLAKFKKHNTPTKPYGALKKKCKRCGTVRAHIQKYDLHLCRRCFREIAKDLGFKKYG